MKKGRKDTATETEKNVPNWTLNFRAKHLNKWFKEVKEDTKWERSEIYLRKLQKHVKINYRIKTK